MSEYNHTHLFAVPMTAYDPATRIAQAFDPDRGGADSFAILRAKDADGNLWAVSYGPNTEEFISQADYLLTNPEALKSAVKAELDARFPDAPDPTLTTVKKFTDSVKWAWDVDLDAGLEEMGLTRYVEESHV